MRRLLSALLVCLLSSQANAGITQVTIGVHNQAAATTNVLTTITNNCAAGSTIVLGAAYTTLADTLSSVTDSGGNTWQTPIDNVTGTGIGIGISYAVNTTSAINIGATITATFAGSVTTEIGATCVQGMATSASSILDRSNNTANGVAATSATTVNSGALFQPNELVMGVLGNATTPGTQTCGGSLNKITFATAVTPSLAMCSSSVGALTSVPFSPTWATSSNYITDLISLNGAVTSVIHVPVTTAGVGQ